MKPDPILKELWDIKDKMAEECGYDLRRLFDRLRETQASPQTGSVVDRTKHRPLATTQR